MIENEEQRISAACRFTASECFYVVSGPEEFVRSNYKQHLRESHHIGHPVIEDDELCRVSVSAETRAADPEAIASPA